jgi:uncharacterized protein (DUF305 family)
MYTRILALGAAALATTAIAACGSPSTDNGSTPSNPSATAVATTSPEAAGPHNQADLMFTEQMIPHHQQAIEMSDIVLAKRGIDPRVVDLANRIKAAQGPEIELMRGWLRQWGAPDMPGMGGHDMGDMPGMPGMGGMPGMMSDDDMTALQAAQGVDASRLYLTQMIEHHRGAITMAQNEIDTGQYPATVALSRSIITTQQREIDTMQKMLPTL